MQPKVIAVIEPPQTYEEYEAQRNPLDEIAHMFCSHCPKDIAICGYVLDEEWIECPYDELDTCVMCVEMEDEPCPRCGSLD